MQFIYDNLVATVVAGILLLMLVGLTLRQQQGSVRATQFHAAKQAQMAFVDMLEEDLDNLGAGVPATSDMMLPAASGGFKFVRMVGSTLTEIEYRPEPSGLLADSVQLYRVVRYVNDIPDGGSASYLTDFDVELQSASGTDVGSDLGQARRISIGFAMTLPFQNTERGDADAGRPVSAIPRLTWEGVFSPPNLSRLPANAET